MKATHRDEVPIIVKVPQLVEQPPSVAFMKACTLAARNVPAKFRLPPRMSTANQVTSDAPIEAAFQKATVVTNSRASLRSRIDLPSLDIGRHPALDKADKVRRHYSTQRNPPLSSWISASSGNTGPSWRRHVLNDTEPEGNLTPATIDETAPRFRRDSNVRHIPSVVIDARLLSLDHRNLQGRSLSRHRYYHPGVYSAAFPVSRESSRPSILSDNSYYLSPNLVPPSSYQRETKRPFGESTVRGTSQASYAPHEAGRQYGLHKRLHHHYQGNRLTHIEAIPQVSVRPSVIHQGTEMMLSRRSDFVTGNVIHQRQLDPPIFFATNRDVGEKSEALGHEQASMTRTPDTKEKSLGPASSLSSVPLLIAKRPPQYTLTNPLIKKARGFDKLDLLCSATLDIGELHDNPTGCSCPKSKCVALYCDCFKAGRRCDPTNCSCFDCRNTIAESGVDGARTKAIRNILSRNPRAFNTAGVGNPSLKLPPGEIACNCVRSKCLKLYCSCFHNGKTCKSGICTCVGCENTEADEDGHRKAAIEQAIEKRADAFVVKPKASGMGCACKNNRCIRKYCECFRTGLGCTEKCTCRECENRSLIGQKRPDLPHRREL